MAPTTRLVKKEVGAGASSSSSNQFQTPVYEDYSSSHHDTATSTTMKESDVQLAKTADELRRFFRFCRPGVPDLERKVSYTVEARVPVSVEAAFDMLKKSKVTNELLHLNSSTTSKKSSKIKATNSSNKKNTKASSNSTSTTRGRKKKIVSQEEETSSSEDDADEEEKDFFSILSERTMSLMVDVLKPSVVTSGEQKNGLNENGSSSHNDSLLSFALVDAIRQMKNSIRSDSNLISINQKKNKKKSRNDDDDEEEEEEEEESDDDDEEQENRNQREERFFSTTGPEILAAAQTSGSFVFSRMNSVRNFTLVGDGLHFQMNNNANRSLMMSNTNQNNNSRGGSTAGSNNNNNIGGRVVGGGRFIKSEVEVNNNSDFGRIGSGRTASGANNINNGAIHVPNLQKVIPMCQTLPLRTHTQRTAKMVHEIALLLALLHELE